MIKLADTLEPMADFPSAYAKDIAFNDGDTLQEKLDTGSLGGGASYTQLSQAEYDALTEEEKMNGKEYRTYDTGHIYKLGVEYGKDAYFTSLSQLGLDTTATLKDITRAMAKGSIIALKVDAMADQSEYNNITQGTVTIHKVEDARVQAIMTNKVDGRTWVGALGSDNTIIGWTKMITEKSDPYACTTYTALTGKEDLFTLPCGHYVTEKADTAYNYPITDSSTFTAHIYVLGHLNDPTNNKGYRIILYFDNKNRMYRINEWWGVFTDNGWQEIVTKDYVDSVTGNTFNGKSVKTLMIDLSNASLQYTGTSDYGEVSLANYINNNINIIRVEGYYNPPSDSSYNNKYVVVAGKGSGTGIGYMSYLNGKWSFVSAKSKGGSLKGNGFIKVYYID